jgi:TPR repeat protein
MALAQGLHAFQSMDSLRFRLPHFPNRPQSVPLFKFALNRAVRLLAAGSILSGVALQAEPSGDVSGQTLEAQPGQVKELWVASELANASKPGFIAQLQKEAAAGNANAQAALGFCYQGGHGVPRDLATAAHWYELAAKSGHAGAEMSLAQLCDLGAGVTQDHRKAFDLFQSAAKQGLAEAQFRTGLHCAMGVGAAQDWAQARSWYEKAAAQGNLTAMGALGDIYLRGRGVPVNYQTAKSYYQKPAEAGIAAVQFNLAAVYMFEKNDAAAVPWLKRSAEGGDPSGEFYWAVCLHYGRAVPRDQAQALLWARKAVQGLPSTKPDQIPHAHALLAQIILDNPRADIRDAEAFREASIAAQTGESEGQYALGRCYLSGVGVSKDVATGIRWYTAAAQQKDGDPALALGAIYEKGTGVPQNLPEAVKWYKMGAENGNTMAAYHLGRCYRDGLGVEANVDEALKWLRVAARALPNNQEVTTALAQLEGQTHKVDPDTAYKQGMALGRAATANGGPMDEAAELLTEAANQGQVSATIILSGWYRRGDHVPKDEERADALIAKVESNTSPAILFQIGLSYMPGANQLPVEKNIDHALGYLQRAADQGYGPAPGPLGFCYMTASAAHQDFVSAFEWLSVAAGQGDQNAAMYLERLRSRLTNAQTQEGLKRLNEIRTRSRSPFPMGPGTAASRPWTE